MKKFRYYLAVFALVATLGWATFQGAAATAGMASSQYASFAAGRSAPSIASIHIYPICPVPGTSDC